MKKVFEFKLFASADCEGQMKYEKLLNMLALRRYSFGVSIRWVSSEMRVATVMVKDWEEHEGEEER